MTYSRTGISYLFESVVSATEIYQTQKPYLQRLANKIESSKNCNLLLVGRLCEKGVRWNSCTHGALEVEVIVTASETGRHVLTHALQLSSSETLR
ncbi:hypothetical protein CDAR_595761 [Caerostris darwini]|uniref:Single-stranded DNA binding protein n=1 Tax=Caerostris darwini TaxID=1538125 RepID=A0AAV4Q594_9ARAC|nr:hypothetical protein CDAR_595761 [Caerostris darwini]